MIRFETWKEKPQVCKIWTGILSKEIKIYGVQVLRMTSKRSHIPLRPFLFACITIHLLNALSRRQLGALLLNFYIHT